MRSKGPQAPGKPPAQSRLCWAPTHPLLPSQFNNMLLYCVPKVIQVGAEFQVHLRMDVEGMKVRQAPCLGASPSSWLLQKPLLWGVAAA